MNSNKGAVYIATTLDTKSDEIFYVSELIQRTGLAVKTVDLTTKPGQLTRKRMSAPATSPLVTLTAKARFSAATAAVLSRQWLSPLNVSLQNKMILQHFSVWADPVERH